MWGGGQWDKVEEVRAGGNPGALPLDYEWTHHVRKQWHSRLRQQQSAWEDGGKEGVYRVWVGMTREGEGDVGQEEASKVSSITETDFL